MPKEPLNEREFELVNIVGAQLAQNQRDLSRHMNLSLGMTNMLLRRLVTKGYIRITQLNQKKVQYLLTSKGFSEKMRKSVRYTLKTIDSIGLVKRSLAALLHTAYKGGARKFYVIGSVDLAGLIEAIAKEEFGAEVGIVRTEVLKASMQDGIVLICREQLPVNGFGALRMINVIEELAKDQRVTNEA